MAPAILARGLSALIALADNPSMQADALVALESPLILYIARVPGSKDIFLTTIKPRQKVVTAQDIGSSLYYFHVDDTQGKDLEESSYKEVEKAHFGGDPELPARKVSSPTIARKPVLPARSSKVERDCLPKHDIYSRSQERVIQHPSVPQNQQQDEREVQWQKQAGDFQTQHRPHDHFALPLLPPRKLIGPRPLHTRNQASDTRPGRAARGKENINPRRWSEQPPTLPPRDSMRQNYGGENKYSPPLSSLPRSTHSRFDQAFSNRSQSFAEEKAAFMNAYAPPVQPGKRHTISSSFTALQHDTSIAPLSIIMIRRDPYSGAQENIGHLTLDRYPAAHQGPSASIELLTPGYSYFTENAGPKSHTSQGSLELEVDSTSFSMESSSTTTSTFRRHINLKSTNSVRSPTPTSFSPQTSIDLSASSSPFSTTSPSAASLRISPLTPPQPSLHKLHTFLSPWQTSCTFSSSAANPSLRLTHTSDRQTIPLSELRSNLPSGPRNRPSSRLSLSTLLHTKLNRNECSYDDDDDNGEADEARMDLSLGQERAGGGLAGKAAKLGKLVVEAEALRMLDLVVAANMAVWWAAYDRSG